LIVTTKHAIWMWGWWDDVWDRAWLLKDW